MVNGILGLPMQLVGDGSWDELKCSWGQGEWTVEPSRIRVR